MQYKGASFLAELALDQQCMLPAQVGVVPVEEQAGQTLTANNARGWRGNEDQLAGVIELHEAAYTEGIAGALDHHQHAAGLDAGASN